MQQTQNWIKTPKLRPNKDYFGLNQNFSDLWFSNHTARVKETGKRVFTKQKNRGKIYSPDKLKEPLPP